MHDVWGIEQGLPQNSVDVITQSRDGYLWLGTEEGLVRFDGADFKIFEKNDTGLPNRHIASIHQDRAGNLWIGSYGGLACLTAMNKKFTTFNNNQEIAGHIITSICEGHEGHLWFGTEESGLKRLKSGTANFHSYTTKHGLANNNVGAIITDRGGNLWIGTEGGLNFLENGRFNVYTTKEGLANNIVCSIYEDRQGNLWIGTRQGLNHLDRHRRDGKFTLTKYTTKDGLSSDIVGPLYEDQQGNLWLGTFGGGLNRLKEGKFTHVTTKEGLFNDVVFTTLEDDKGNFWMSCNKGIFRVSQKELNDCCEGRISNVHCVSYNEKDGMKSRECNGGSQPAGWKSRDGKLWFPTIKGLVMIDPENIKSNRLPPPVKIEEITMGSRKILPPFPLGENEKELVLSPGEELYEIHYTALSFLAPGKVQFKYKLEGFDTGWREVGTRRTAYYNNLSPGNYTFYVKACNDDGLWNEAGAAVSFYLKPYFYQTWWFYIMCAFGALFLAFGIYRLRVRQITNLKIELERLVDERTRQLEESGKELKKLSIVARETHNAVAILDANGNREWMNEGTTRMYGYTMEQLFETKGKNITQISSHPDIEELLA